MDVDRKLKRFYAHLLAHDRDINAISDDEWQTIGMEEQEARALLSRPDFPWAEVEQALRDDEHAGKLADNLGMLGSEEYVRELRNRLRDPHGKPFA